MFKKITTIFMATLIFINSIFLSSQNMNVNAQGDIIKSIKFEKNDLSHMEVTGISVEFGGAGTKVSSGQTETIRFDGNNAKLEMPSNPIELRDGAGYSLGRVEFSQGSATIIFNDYAASLDDVEGRFDFNATAVYQGDQSQPGSGDITANYGYNTEKATVNYSGAGGTETSNVYSKKGVTSIDNPDKVDWVFSLNMAQKSVNYPGEQVSYIITDTLDDTMEWDLDAINSNPYVVNFEGGYTSTIFGTWVSLERAKELGIKVNMTGQKLYIEVPPAFNNGSGWFSSLDQTAISIRLSSKIKDEVMNDTSVKYVDNSSDVVINGADDSWKINPEDTSDSVKILRQGGSAYGTKPGELKIFKTIENKKIGIKDVTFELKRNDGKDIVIAGDNKGKSIEIKTDGNGLANIKGLPVATYIVKEKSAPSWIEFNERESIEETFEVKSTDKDGTLLEISNKKKKIDINVEKKWNTDLKDLPEVRLNLLKDGVIEGEEILLKDGKTSHQWKDLDLADDYGKEYEYTVKEVGEENGKIVLDGKSYKVDVSGNMKSGYVITNTQDKPLIPLEPALRSIKVSKDWKDSEGKVIDPKVESIMVELYKNGSATGNKLELSKENNWSAEFTKLKVSETVGGENNDYTVKEVNGEDGKIKIADKWYKVSVSGNMSEGFKIVNTQNRPLIPIEPALRSIKVSKDWKDSEGKVIDPKLESIMVELYKNGSATGNKLELNKENNWSGEFVNLKYSDALALGEHNYTVKEVGEENGKIVLDGKSYKVDVSGNMKSGYVITNTQDKPLIPLEPALRSVKVSKDWKDSEGKVIDPKVESIMVELYKNGSATGNKLELSKENNWSAEFTKLKVSETVGGENNDYTVKEVNGEDGKIKISDKWYKVSVSGNMSEGFKIVNTQNRPLIPIEPALRSIKVSKDWKDSEGKVIDPKLESIMVELYKNGSATGNKLELNKENNWSGEFVNLKYSDALALGEHNYTVKEVGEENGKIVLDGKSYKVDVSGDMKSGYVITNTQDKPWTPMEPALRSVKVSKDWKDSEGKAIDPKVENIMVELYKNGSATGNKLELNKENNWSAEFTKLKVSETVGGENNEYTVKEVGEENGKIVLDGKSYKVDVSGDMKSGYVITNTQDKPWTPMEPALRSVKVSKDWKDSEGKAIDPKVENIMVELYKNGSATGNKLELNKENNWSAEFTKLKVSETVGGENNEYTVKEVGEENGKIVLDGKSYKVDVSGNMKSGYVITNTQDKPLIPLEPALRSIKVSKDWKDSEGKVVDPKVESIMVELYKNGSATGNKLELNKENNWSAEFTKLKVSETVGGENNEYTVKEVGEENGKIVLDGKSYKVDVSGNMKSGYVITNTQDKPLIPLEPALRSIKVSKDWKDSEGKVIDPKVESIMVELYKNGSATGNKLELSKENNWSAEFTKLKVSETVGGENNDYTVKEVNGEDGKIKIADKWYKVSVSGNMSEGFKIVNTQNRPLTPMEPALRSIKVSKDWKDSEGNRTNSPVKGIVVELYKNGSSTGIKKELNDSNNWSTEFTNLKYSDALALGEHNYTVKEVGGENGKIRFDGVGYNVELSGNMKCGFTITNRKSKPNKPNSDITIKFEKNWKNNMGERMDAPIKEIYVELYKNGASTGSVKRLDKTNKWSAEFTNLKVSETVGGENNEYTVKEVNGEDGNIVLDGKSYKVDVSGDMKSGYVITNTQDKPWTPMEPALRSVKVSKDWKDSEGKVIDPKVESIMVELYKNGSATENKLELNKENNWSGEFTKLKVSETVGGKNNKYTVKEVNGENGKIVLDGKSYKVDVSGDMKSGYVITNTQDKPLIPLEPALRSVKVSKDWKDSEGNKINSPVKEIVVELYKNGSATGMKKELNASNNWSAEFTHLKKLDSLSLLENSYTVKEVGGENGKIHFDGVGYNVELSGNMKCGFTITNRKFKPNNPNEPSKPNKPNKPSKPNRPNKLNSIVTIKFEKNWKNNMGVKIDAPVKEIYVELYKNGVATGEVKRLDKTNNWSSQFQKLKYNHDNGRVKNNYTVKEVGEEDGYIKLADKWYESEVDEYRDNRFRITNTEQEIFMGKTPIHKDIVVTKVWKDTNGNKIDSPEVKSVKVKLYKNSEEIGKKELKESNSWSSKFEKVDISDKSSEYTVKEEGEDGGKIVLGGKTFKVEVSGDMREGFTVTNKMIDSSKTEDVPIKKSTSDSGKADSSSKSKMLPKTGEAIFPVLYSTVIGLLGLLLFLIGYKRNKNEKKVK